MPSALLLRVNTAALSGIVKIKSSSAALAAWDKTSAVSLNVASVNAFTERVHIARECPNLSHQPLRGPEGLVSPLHTCIKS